MHSAEGVTAASAVACLNAKDIDKSEYDVSAIFGLNMVGLGVVT